MRTALAIVISFSQSNEQIKTLEIMRQSVVLSTWARTDNNEV